jgi:hypothetical protein
MDMQNGHEFWISVLNMQSRNPVGYPALLTTMRSENRASGGVSLNRGRHISLCVHPSRKHRARQGSQPWPAGELASIKRQDLAGICMEKRDGVGRESGGSAAWMMREPDPEAAAPTLLNQSSRNMLGKC